MPKTLSEGYGYLLIFCSSMVHIYSFSDGMEHEHTAAEHCEWRFAASVGIGKAE